MGQGRVSFGATKPDPAVLAQRVRRHRHIVICEPAAVSLWHIADWSRERQFQSETAAHIQFRQNVRSKRTLGNRRLIFQEVESQNRAVLEAAQLRDLLPPAQEHVLLCAINDPCDADAAVLCGKRSVQIFRGTLHQAPAGVGDDELHAVEAAVDEVAQERRPAALISKPEWEPGAGYRRGSTRTDAFRARCATSV